MPQQYETLARDLYIALLKMKTASEQVLANEPWDLLRRTLKSCAPIMAEAGAVFDSTLTHADTVVWSRSNPRIPEGYALVSNKGRGDGYPNNGFDEDAICSDDGIQWYRISRIGEPGCASLTAERIK